MLPAMCIYDNTAQAVTFQAITNGSTVYTQTTPCPLQMGQPYTATIKWAQNRVSCYVGTANFTAPGNQLLNWTTGNYKLVFGGRGSITYQPVQINNTAVPWNYESMDLPTTQQFVNSAGNTLMTLQPATCWLQQSANAGVVDYYQGQDWGGIQDYPLVTNSSDLAGLQRDIPTMRSMGKKLIVYTASLLSNLDPNFQTDSAAWLSPEVTEAYNGGAGTEVIFPVCPRVQSYENWKWGDYSTDSSGNYSFINSSGNYQATIAGLGIDGVYMDGSCNPYFCTADYPCYCALENRAGTAQVGRYNIFAVRSLMKQLRETFNVWNPNFLVVAHCEVLPMYTISFADVRHAPEKTWGSTLRLWENRFRWGWSGLALPARRYGIEVAPYADGWNCTSQQALPFLTMLGSNDKWIFYQKSLPVAWSALNHFGLANSTFVPFWQNPLVNTLPTGVYASVYVHNGSDALIMLTNYSGFQSPPVSVTINPQTLIGKSALSQTQAVNYVRALTTYPISNNTFTIGSLAPYDWTMVYVQ